MGDLEAEGAPAPLFRFGVSQDEKDSFQADRRNRAGVGLSLLIATTTSWIIRAFQQIRKQYIEHVTKMLTLAGRQPRKGAKEAAA